MTKEGWLWVGVSLLVAAVLGLLALLSRLPPQPAHRARARIVRFGGNASKWAPSTIWVVAAGPNGLEGSKQIDMTGFSCSVGDVVAADQRGVSLDLDLSTCVNGGHGVR